MERIEIAKGRGATLRVGPELEIPSVIEPEIVENNHNIHRQRLRMLGSFSGRYIAVFTLMQTDRKYLP